MVPDGRAAAAILAGGPAQPAAAGLGDRGLRRRLRLVQQRLLRRLRQPLLRRRQRRQLGWALRRRRERQRAQLLAQLPGTAGPRLQGPAGAAGRLARGRLLGARDLRLPGRRRLPRDLAARHLAQAGALAEARVRLVLGATRKAARGGRRRQPEPRQEELALLQLRGGQGGSARPARRLLPASPPASAFCARHSQEAARRV
mmetsp:Transcript_76409/g.247435  ORF Transcript_76409/g.247435 Transcript_76409/m.247435 type:complete len:201 (+) Transcript_76409:86-688(+)